MTATTARPRILALGTLGWLWIGVPFTYGLVQLITKIPGLVHS